MEEKHTHPILAKKLCKKDRRLLSVLQEHESAVCTFQERMAYCIAHVYSFLLSIFKCTFSLSPPSGCVLHQTSHLSGPK